MVAPLLVGAVLEVDAGTPQAVRARIVEVEAYLGEDDAASHAGRGRTPRSAMMFGDAGHLYVYLSYGVHHCANVVCSPLGAASAVLLRAAEVVDGVETVRARRGVVADVRLLSGPGNLCRGLGITLADNGADLCDERRFAVFARDVAPPIARSARVGISKNVAALLRFSDVGSLAVSAGRRAATQKRTGTAAGPHSLPNLVRRPGF